MMQLASWLCPAIPLASLLAGLAIFLIREDARTLRTLFNIAGALAKLLLVGYLVWSVYHDGHHEFRIPLFLEFDLVLQADALSLMFVSLAASLWLLTLFYTIGYLENEGIGNRRRFFGFFNLCISATTGIALAGNLFTYLFFYELLTVSTYPLVVHSGSRPALEAGRVYLVYTILGGVALLLGMVWLSSMVGPVDFQPGGILGGLLVSHRGALITIFVLLIFGFGVKSALFPLHSWLPMAMIAPVPVSALLHAVAVVNAGAFGIIRTVYDVYGVAACEALNLTHPLVAVAAVTILYGSCQALFQNDIKHRLAYSTVSQIAYIVLGVAILSPVATVGGIVHLVHQGIMKITMFFCAGNFAQGLHVKQVSQMNGAGRLMPWSMAAFTLATLAMIGVPPMAGFVSKWYLGIGAWEAGTPWIIIVLLTSSVLNAGYFLPMLYRGWFLPPDPELVLHKTAGRLELHPMLLFPPLLTAGATVLAGLLAELPFSPLQWARMIMTKEYGP